MAWYRRSAYRRKFSRSRKSYAFAKSRYRKYKRKYRPKPVKGRKTLAISNRRLYKKTNLHWGDYIDNRVRGIPNDWITIWQTTGLDNQIPAQNYLFQPIPLQYVRNTTYATLDQAMVNVGAAGGEGGIVGDRVWYTHSLDLRFNLTRANLNTDQSSVFIRLVVVSQRNDNITLQSFAQQYTNLNAPIFYKDWKVRHDKVYSLATGQMNQVAAGGAGMNGCYFKPMNFRFKIPFKYRAEYPLVIPPAQQGVWSPPLNTYVLIYSSLANIVNLSNVFCRQYFKIKP